MIHESTHISSSHSRQLCISVVSGRDLDDVRADDFEAREALEDFLDFLWVGARYRQCLGYTEAVHTLVVNPPISGLRG